MLQTLFSHVAHSSAQNHYKTAWIYIFVCYKPSTWSEDLIESYKSLIGSNMLHTKALYYMQSWSIVMSYTKTLQNGMNIFVHYKLLIWPEVRIGLEKTLIESNTCSIQIIICRAGASFLYATAISRASRASRAWAGLQLGSKPTLLMTVSEFPNRAINVKHSNTWPLDQGRDGARCDEKLGQEKNTKFK